MLGIVGAGVNPASWIKNAGYRYSRGRVDPCLLDQKCRV